MTEDDDIDWYALSNGLPTVMPDGTLIHGEEIMAYDERCYELAVAVLKDTPELNNEDRLRDLAQNIQDEIEAWISAEYAVIEILKRKLERPKRPIDPNIIYPGKDLTNTFPQEEE